METVYATALAEMIKRGVAPKQAVDDLHASLVARGRQALMPRIARAFARITARERQKSGVVLSVAHESAGRTALKQTSAILAEIGASADDVRVAVDDSLIGGWRLEGRERLVDASFKKYLLEMYNRAIA